MIRNFLTFFKAGTSYGFFHYVTCGIFAHWFSLNQMFVIKFSVSFATEVEKTRPSHVFFLNRGLRSTKELKETDTFLLQRTTYVA